MNIHTMSSVNLPAVFYKGSRTSLFCSLKPEVMATLSREIGGRGGGVIQEENGQDGRKGRHQD